MKVRQDREEGGSLVQEGGAGWSSDGRGTQEDVMLVR